MSEIYAGGKYSQTFELTLSQSVMYYRDEWLLERGFHRFKRGSLPALPIYFQNQNRIIGLMFLLNIALRVFTFKHFNNPNNLYKVSMMAIQSEEPIALLPSNY